MARRLRIKGKKAYGYLIEIAFVVILTVVILSYLPRSEQGYLDYYQETNMKSLADGTVKGLDDMGVFTALENQSSGFPTSNATKMIDQYLEESLPNYINFESAYS